MKHLYLENHIYFITTVTHKRKRFFDGENNCEILLRVVRYYRERLSFRVYGYVILPDHIHALIQVPEGLDISTIMHCIKRASAYQINQILHTKGPVWQAGYHEHVIRDEKDLKGRLNYIHKNPLKAGLVENLEYYKFSSFRNYYQDDDSVFEVDKILVKAG
ncbi:MAG: transposase [candidate division Zixibacteria bacterium]|nr:transposase [candidate division Zixibacteria bacterium]